MRDRIDLLNRIRPLADPVRITAGVIFLWAVLAGLWVGILSGSVWTGIAAACPLLGLALLIQPGGRPNAIYLRAFRSDYSTSSLRAELAAILGPSFRLAGIRPPREKSSMFMRFLTPGLFALRYAGSKYMELEAGDDWLARLWKTYQSTRIVFIDLRDVTPYVHQEIEMTFAAMGADRCVFLVDHLKVQAEWRQLLTGILRSEEALTAIKILDVTPAIPAPVELLRVRIEQMVETRQPGYETFRQIPTERRIGFALSLLSPDSRASMGLPNPEDWRPPPALNENLHLALKSFLESLPAGTPRIREDGALYILSHVNEKLLRNSGRSSARAFIGAVLGLAIGQGIGFLPLAIPNGQYLLYAAGVLLFGPMLVLLLSAYSRSKARSRMLLAAGFGTAAANQSGVLLMVLILYLCIFLIPVVQLLANLANSSQQ